MSSHSCFQEVNCNILRAEQGDAEHRYVQAE